MWFSTCTLRTALADLHGEDLIWLIAIVAAPASGSAQPAPAGLEPATLRLQVQSLAAEPPGHYVVVVVVVVPVVGYVRVWINSSLCLRCGHKVFSRLLSSEHLTLLRP